MIPVAISSLRLLHGLCLLFILLGWALPKPWVYGHIVFLPVVVIHWWQNQGRCILTQWEHQLRGAPPEEKVQGAFTQSLFRRFGLQPSDRQLFFIIYALLCTSWFASLWKIL